MHITTRTLLAAPPVLLEPVIRKLLEKNDTHSHDKYSDDDYLNNTKFNPSMAIIIVVLLTAFFFMGFFSLYVRRCTEDSSTTGRRRVGPGNGLGRLEPAHRGLDKEVIESFPVFTYDLLKGLKTQTKEIMECAVCLNDFADDEQLRLLPKCGHAFHPECIDMWLSSNTTCPVCRTSLVPDDMTNPTGTGFGVIEPVIEPVEDAPEITVPVPVGSMSRRTVGFSLPTSNEGSGRPSRQGSVRPSREGSLRGSLEGSRRASEPKVLDRSESPIKEEGPGNSHSNLSRSYSTGHSLVRLRKDMGEERSTEWFISTPKGLTPASHKTCTYAINQAMALHSKSQGYNIGASKFSRFPFFSKQFSFVRDGGQQQQTVELQNSGSIRRWYEKRFKSERNSTEMDPANFRRSLSERTGVASDCVFNPEGYNPQSHEHQEDAAKAYILNLKKTLKRITGIDDESPSSSNTVVASPVIAGGSVSAKGIVKAGSL